MGLHWFVGVVVLCPVTQYYYLDKHRHPGGQRLGLITRFLGVSVFCPTTNHTLETRADTKGDNIWALLGSLVSLCSVYEQKHIT